MSQPSPGAGLPLRIQDSGRYFETPDGTPWFWLADTSWSMCTDYTPEETRAYLMKRAQTGFSLVQISPIFDGGTMTERGDNPNRNTEGFQPWIDHDPLRPVEEFWQNVDATVRLARELGLYVGLLPAWGSYVVNTKMITRSNGRAYGRWLGRRYRNEPNIIWIVGGDRKLVDERETWCEIARGLAEGDGGAHLITFHPGCEEHSTSFGFHQEPWLAMNMVQTWKDYINIPGYVAEGYQLMPPKPVILAEGAYEDGPEYSQPITPLVIRKQAWWSYLSGGFHTYGHGDMWKKNPTWEKSLRSEGTRNIRVLRDLFDSLDWWNLVPAQEIFVREQVKGAAFNSAARSKQGNWALIYLAGATTVELRLDGLRSAKVSATWLHPANGGRISSGDVSGKLASFTTPDGWEDAVLALRAE